MNHLVVCCRIICVRKDVEFVIKILFNIDKEICLSDIPGRTTRQCSESSASSDIGATWARLHISLIKLLINTLD